ncbi:hypothetical protein GCM10011348_46130 [Marinobacterium nitratireducens]|uniref:AAA+ ATPase domain-containing protein n=1 Tax=Marinobacterium nitratireducens TaxID=518897 RepID=A0A918DYL5_9GAMM|nr:ATP-binding protein [Marinobacterium nitratireducens]GGO89121.1 hypothetical protein GCM10011348_46130 [Marinobacterium nitratireducens]
MFDTVRTEPRHCEKHDLDWTLEVTKFCGREIENNCPQCQAEIDRERDERDRDAREQEFRRNRIEHERRMLERRLSASEIPAKYQTRTFANYRAKDEGQVRALTACQRFADNFHEFQRTGAGLIMTGRPGTGKTHLACAIANQLIGQGHTAVFITVSKMIRKIRETYRRDSEHTEQQVIDSLRDVDLLIIDEVGIQRGTESEEHLLFEVLNERNSVFAPTVLLSNLTATEIKAFIGERAMDRLREGGGKLVVFDWDSYRGQVVDDDGLPCADQVKAPASPRPLPSSD